MNRWTPSLSTGARAVTVAALLAALAGCGGSSSSSTSRSGSASTSRTTRTTGTASTSASHTTLGKPPARPNGGLITNGSFEGSTAGWRPYVTLGASQHFATSRMWSVVGKSSLLMTAAHSPSPTVGRAEAETVVRVKAGCTYDLHSAIKVTPHSTQHAVEERILWILRGAPSQQLQRDATATRPGVYRLTVSGRAPVKALSAEVGVGVLLGGSQTSTFSIDGILLQSRCRGH